MPEEPTEATPVSILRWRAPREREVEGKAWAHADDTSKDAESGTLGTFDKSAKVFRWEAEGVQYADPLWDEWHNRDDRDRTPGYPGQPQWEPIAPVQRFAEEFRNEVVFWRRTSGPGECAWVATHTLDKEVGEIFRWIRVLANDGKASNVRRPLKEAVAEKKVQGIRVEWVGHDHPVLSYQPRGDVDGVHIWEMTTQRLNDSGQRHNASLYLVIPSHSRNHPSQLHSPPKIIALDYDLLDYGKQESSGQASPAFLLPRDNMMPVKSFLKGPGPRITLAEGIPMPLRPEGLTSDSGYDFGPKTTGSAPALDLGDIRTRLREVLDILGADHSGFRHFRVASAWACWDGPGLHGFIFEEAKVTKVKPCGRRSKDLEVWLSTGETFTITNRTKGYAVFLAKVILARVDARDDLGWIDWEKDMGPSKIFEGRKEYESFVHVEREGNHPQGTCLRGRITLRLSDEMMNDKEGLKALRRMIK